MCFRSVFVEMRIQIRSLGKIQTQILCLKMYKYAPFKFSNKLFKALFFNNVYLTHKPKCAILPDPNPDYFGSDPLNKDVFGSKGPNILQFRIRKLKIIRIRDTGHMNPKLTGGD